MTVNDRIKILDAKVKSNQAQHDLGRKAAKISALLSKNLLDKYEYLTGQNLGRKPNVFEKAKFEYSTLGMVLTNNNKSKTNKNKAGNKKKQDKNVFYNSRYSFAKFKSIYELNKLSYYSLYKKLNKFCNKFNKLTNVNPEADERKDLSKGF